MHESSVISICSHPESPIAVDSDEPENVRWLPCRGRLSQVVTGAEDATAKVVQIETGKAPTPPQRFGVFFPNFPENKKLWSSMVLIGS